MKDLKRFLQPAMRALAGLILAVAATARAATPAPGEAAEAFLEHLDHGDYAAAIASFDDTMTKVVPEAKMRQIWEGAQAQFGAFKKRLRWRSEKLGAYEAVLVTCEFERQVMEVKVVFDAKRRIAGLFFVPPKDEATFAAPPGYANTNLFREKPVMLGQEEWQLPGVLTMPTAGKSPCAGVVLVHGSGPNDRDETVGANRPFRDLAWGLASKGVAVLRYDKRTKVHGAKLGPVMATLTLKEETIDDALSAAALLRQSEGVGAARVFVLGHSLGGMAAPRIGKANPKLGGLIILAGSTRPLEDLIVEQTKYILSLQPASEQAAAKLTEVQTAMAKVKQLKPSDAGSATPIFGACPAYWLDLRSYNPAETVRSLDLPLLVLQGARDYQVGLADFEGWKKALADRTNATLKLYPDLNHLFISGTGPSSPAEYDRASHVAEQVVTDIAKWIEGK